jgi:hypothetical protein
MCACEVMKCVCSVRVCVCRLRAQPSGCWLRPPATCARTSPAALDISAALHTVVAARVASCSYCYCCRICLCWQHPKLCQIKFKWIETIDPKTRHAEDDFIPLGRLQNVPSLIINSLQKSVLCYQQNRVNPIAILSRKWSSCRDQIDHLRVWHDSAHIVVKNTYKTHIRQSYRSEAIVNQSLLSLTISRINLE